LDEVENFSLRCVQFVVFDEGDRLFEMGFKDEINLILTKVPDSEDECLLLLLLLLLIYWFVLFLIGLCVLRLISFHFSFLQFSFVANSLL
jgi:hypothetical protein